MIKFFALLSLLLSCTSGNSLLKDAQTSQAITFKTITVDSPIEAKKYILNQRNYLVLLFEQSRDPYYGVPKWNEQCLKDNRIGEIHETQENVLLVSRLYFDKSGNPGFCFENRPPYYGQHIIIYCKNKNQINDLKVNNPNDLKLKDSNLCE